MRGLLLIGEEGFEFDHAGARGGFELFEAVGELDAALGVDGHFESGDVLEAPSGVSDGLGQIAFALGERFEFFCVGQDVLFVGSGVVGGEQDGAARECGLDGIL